MGSASRPELTILLLEGPATVLFARYSWPPNAGLEGLAAVYHMESRRTHRGVPVPHCVCDVAKPCHWLMGGAQWPAGVAHRSAGMVADPADHLFDHFVE